MRDRWDSVQGEYAQTLIKLKLETWETHHKWHVSLHTKKDTLQNDRSSDRSKKQAKDRSGWSKDQSKQSKDWSKQSILFILGITFILRWSIMDWSFVIAYIFADSWLQQPITEKFFVSCFNSIQFFIRKYFHKFKDIHKKINANTYNNLWKLPKYIKLLIHFIKEHLINANFQNSH